MKKLFAILVTMCMLLSMANLSLAQETIHLVYWSPETDETSIAVDNAIIDAFEELHPGVEIELQHGSLSDILAKISAMAMAGTAPDIAFFSPRYIAAMVEEGHLLELTDLFNEIGDIPASYVTPTGSDAIYDIPCVMDSICLVYRTDLFEAAGLTPPTTWEEWLACAEKLTQDTNGDGVNDTFGMTMMGGIPDNYFGFTPYLWANGADFFDAQNNVAIDSPAAIEALTFAKNLAQFCPPGMENVNYADTLVMFANGQTAMCVGPGRVLINIKNYKPELLDVVDIVPIPAGPSGDQPLAKVSLNDFVVFNSTEHPELCKEFIKFYMSDAQYQLFLTESAPGHMLPTRTAYLEDESYLSSPDIVDIADLVKKSLDYSFTYGSDYVLRNDGVYNPNLSEALASAVMTQQINKMYLGEVTPEEAAKAIAETWRDDFGIN